MRQRVLIIVTIAVVLGLLVALNAANYVQKDRQEDSEWRPDRSTYNFGPTGTRALFELLSESGYKVTRWRETPAGLAENKPGVATFVIVGETRLPVEKDQAEVLLAWVEAGGRLVIIDRAPATYLLPRSGHWNVSTQWAEFPPVGIDSANSQQMTEGTKRVHPVQPTSLTRDVHEVRPSRFASAIRFYRTDSSQPATKTHPQESAGGDEEGDSDPVGGEAEPPSESRATSAAITSPAPVVHLSNSQNALLVDYPKGRGRIVVLTDPYIVANGGIKLEDNLRLTLNILAVDKGLIAFDEYHQGHGANHDNLITYFAGTPVLAIFGQLVLLGLVILWTRGRRFARPLPLAQIDRRSSLEFVASMAELQQRAGALDLALENIYSRTRRVLTRYAGVDYHSSRSEIAERVASRSSLNREKLESLMRSCEDAINGGPISERQAIELVKRLRQVEGALGLRMRLRDAKQAAESV